MRILFTGGSSFTGYWFIQELARAGHEVTAVFQSSEDHYTGMRKERVELLKPVCQRVFSCQFGSDEFLRVIKEGKNWDVLCHHAADVTNYKSPDFDVSQAVHRNTYRIQDVLAGLEDKGCRKIVLTGSVFESNEGAGSELWRAFSPYGLSKSLTSDMFRFYTAQRQLKFGKFVIPNPFGPFEEPRFTTYLIQNWAEGKVPSVNTPSYVRDNIPVSLLAKAYGYFVENLSNECPRYEKMSPSCYVESQGDFALRFSREMEKRLSCNCQVVLNKQAAFPEPKIRINTDAVMALPLTWDESAAWDELADYYLHQFKFLSRQTV